MKAFNTAEIVEQAIQTEKLGHNFYTKMAERFADNGALKALFEELAAKELYHEKKFLALRDKVESRVIEGSDEFNAYMRAIVESEFFLGSNKSLPSLDHVQSVKDAVRFALGFEKESLLYYFSMQDMYEKDEIIDEIIREEQNHIRVLSEFKKSL